MAIKDKDGNIVTFIEAKEKYDANLFSISIGSHMFNAQWLDTKDHRFLGIRPSADFDIWRVDGTNFQKKLGKTPRMTKLKILDVIQERLNDKSEGKFNDWFFNTYIPG